MNSVYFVLAVGTPLMKVGFTSNPVKERVSDLQVGNGHQLEVIAIVRGNESDERMLHSVLSPIRVRGEWFDLSRWHLLSPVAWKSLPTKFYMFPSHQVLSSVAKHGIQSLARTPSNWHRDASIAMLSILLVTAGKLSGIDATFANAAQGLAGQANQSVTNPEGL